MAHRCTADANSLERGALIPGDPAGSGPGISLLCWAKLDALANWKCPVSVDVGASAYLYIETDDASPREWHLYCRSEGDNAAFDFTIGVDATTGWWFLAVTWLHAGTCVAYAAPFGGTITSASHGVNSASFMSSDQRLLVGTDWYGGEYLNGGTAHVKVWNRQLTAAQVAAEMYSFRPVTRTDLLAWYPLVSATVPGNLIDWSGNGMTLTANGTPAVQDGPPLPWGGRPMLVGNPPPPTGATITGRCVI